MTVYPSGLPSGAEEDVLPFEDRAAATPDVLQGIKPASSTVTRGEAIRAVAALMAPYLADEGISTTLSAGQATYADAPTSTTLGSDLAEAIALGWVANWAPSPPSDFSQWEPLKRYQLADLLIEALGLNAQAIAAEQRPSSGVSAQDAAELGGGFSLGAGKEALALGRMQDNPGVDGRGDGSFGPVGLCTGEAAPVQPKHARARRPVRRGFRRRARRRPSRRSSRS